MIIPGNASLILSAVQQLIKLGQRIDTLMAQRTAVQTSLVLGMPGVRLGSIIKQRAIVQKALDATEGQVPDPFGSDRAALRQQVTQPQPDASFDTLFLKYFPEQDSALVSPDAAFLAQLQKAYPSLNWSDPGVRVAALAIAAGADKNAIGYNARVALAVADTLLEFGAENTALFVRDAKLQGVVQSVLQRFAQPDWSSFEEWNPLLQTALKTTLNAALDVGDKLSPKNPWLDSVLDALVQARAAASNPDDYLLGLMQGQGVPLLLSQGLLVASHRLADDQAPAFRLVAADVLAAAAPFIQQQDNPDLAQFFRDHWCDLLRAGLSSVDQHGDRIINTSTPLLNGVLKALVQQLAKTPDAGFLSSETLYQLADTAIGVVADNPAELNGLTSKPWLASFLAAAAASAKELTAKKLFTPEAATALLQDAIGILAKYPDLVIRGEGLPLTLASSIFSAFAQLPPAQFSRLDARTVGETALRSALTALASDPSLASRKFGPVVSAVATQLAGMVGQGSITTDQAAALATTAIEAVARNPAIYAGAEAGVAGTVLTAVQKAFPANASWAARLLVDTVRQTLLAVGRYGAPATAGKPLPALEQLLTTIVSSGLATAENQLGASTDLDGIPPILGGLVAQALRGDLTVLDPNSPQFIAAFKAIAAQLQPA